ncbi:MAG: sugar phosphate isomerase/epimerase family protein [Candidatus Bipolaricaulia bacterium]
MAELDLRIGVSIWGFYGQSRESWPSLDDAVRSILSIDSTLGVEVWASKALDAPAAGGSELDALIEACRGAGFVTVHVRGVFWYWDPVKLRREIDFVQSVGGRTLVVHPVCFGLKRPEDRMDVSEIRRIAEYAAEKYVRLAVENVRDSIWILDRVLNEIGDDPEETNLGICIDVGHAHLSSDAGRESVCDYLERYADPMVHLHLHDNAGARDEHLAPGEGTIDWHRVLGVLKETGYSGTAVLEIHGSEISPLAAIEKSVRVLRAFA